MKVTNFTQYQLLMFQIDILNDFYFNDEMNLSFQDVLYRLKVHILIDNKTLEKKINNVFNL
jgi:hypothetical protein